MTFSGKKQKKSRTGLITLLIIISLFSIYLLSDGGIIGFVVNIFAEVEGDPSVVLNLTFDDKNNPWKDYSIYNHVFTANGEVNWVNKSYCKWYGCGNFSSSYLNSSTKFNLDNGIAVEFWEYLSIDPDISGSAQFGIGRSTTNNRGLIHDDNLGLRAQFDCEYGTANAGTGDGEESPAEQWIHVFIQYDEDRMYIYRNGILKVNSSEPYGNMNYTIGELMNIGRISPDGTQTMKGYLDEFLVWNKSNFTSSDVLAHYNEKRLGTPPDLDLYVKSIRYNLPYNWSNWNNAIITGGTMDINFTISNAGKLNSSNFIYNLTINNQEVCSAEINIPSKNTRNISCSWATQYGFWDGNLSLDITNTQSEDDESNNNQKIYVPFLNKPYILINLTNWYDNLLGYNMNTSNDIAYSSWNRFKSFSCSAFSDSYTGNNVDPYGKKARECAIGCLLNDYDMNNENCIKAKNHIFGWANRTVTSYTNVQSLHELFHVSVAYDIIFPILTQTENELLSQGFHDICQQITNLDNTRPDQDNKEEINGGNGWGFGSGMAGFCYSILGAYKENPTLIQELDTQYWGGNIANGWMDREKSYLRAMKNDSWTYYQEGYQYKTYSQYHLLENTYYEKLLGFSYLDSYQNALCAMTKENLLILLDTNYNGNDLRNDYDQRFRNIQKGDGSSYQDPSDGSFISWGTLYYYSYLCDETNVKGSLIWLRDKANNVTDATYDYVSLFLDKPLRTDYGNIKPESFMPKVMFDNANDILTIRTNYTYRNDTVIQIDGGEERGGGHSQAQGYYLYALGEPFLDYEQVPYEDDVRDERWKNGISFQNTLQSVEGEDGQWSRTCGDHKINQYYGSYDGTDCSSNEVIQNYPNYRTFPLEYGGDLEDYLGTKNANLAGVYVWRPYYNADPVEEYFVKFDNLLAKRTVVNNNNEGNIYHNFININDEFTETRANLNITFERTRWDNKKVYLDIIPIYSNQTLTIGGGETNINYCFSKTSCSGSSRGNGNYRRTYLHTEANNIDFILAHHWYYEGEKQTVSSIDNNDKGVKQGNNIIIFDTDNNQNTSYNNKETDGWALAYNDNQIAAFNATRIRDNNIILLQSDRAISAHLERDSDRIILTANTMERDPYIDVSKTARVTIDAQELSKNSEFGITKNDEEIIPIISESGTQVTFDITTEQNSDYYTITGSGEDTINPIITSITNTSTTNQSSNIEIATNENTNLTLIWGYNQLNNTLTSSTYQTPSSISLTPLIPNTTIYYNITCCDSNGNCVSEGTYSFKTAETILEEETPAEEETEETSSSSGGGGGGGASTAKVITLMDEWSIVELRTSQKLVFDYKEEQHHLFVDKADENSAELSIYSERIQVKLKKGETRKVDINNDKNHDIEVTYYGKEGTKTKLGLKITGYVASEREGIETQESETTEEIIEIREEETGEGINLGEMENLAPKEKSWLEKYLIVIIILSLNLILVIVAVSINKKRKNI